MKIRKGTTYLQNDDYYYESTIEMFNFYYDREVPLTWTLTHKTWKEEGDDHFVGYIDTEILLGDLLKLTLGDEYVSTIYRNHKG